MNWRWIIILLLILVTCFCYYKYKERADQYTKLAQEYSNYQENSRSIRSDLRKLNSDLRKIIADLASGKTAATKNKLKNAVTSDAKKWGKKNKGKSPDQLAEEQIKKNGPDIEKDINRAKNNAKNVCPNGAQTPREKSGGVDCSTVSEAVNGIDEVYNKAKNAKTPKERAEAGKDLHLLRLIAEKQLDVLIAVSDRLKKQYNSQCATEEIKNTDECKNLKVKIDAVQAGIDTLTAIGDAGEKMNFLEKIGNLLSSCGPLVMSIVSAPATGGTSFAALAASEMEKASSEGADNTSGIKCLMALLNLFNSGDGDDGDGRSKPPVDGKCERDSAKYQQCCQPDQPGCDKENLDGGCKPGSASYQQCCKPGQPNCNKKPIPPVTQVKCEKTDSDKCVYSVSLSGNILTLKHETNKSMSAKVELPDDYVKIVKSGGITEIKRSSSNTQMTIFVDNGTGLGRKIIIQKDTQTNSWGVVQN